MISAPGTARGQGQRALNKVATLRGRRLQLADMEVANANAAVESALRALAEARLAATKAAEHCMREQKCLNEELASAGGVEKGRIYTWKSAQKRLNNVRKAARVTAKEAQIALATSRALLEQAKARRRAVALDVEKLATLIPLIAQRRGHA